MMLNSTMKKTFRAALAIVCAGTLMAGTAACGSTSSSGGDKVALLVSTLNTRSLSICVMALRPLPKILVSI